MDRWAIKFKLLSETILGSGKSIPGFIDIDILQDEYGMPYFKGKTFKGKLREEAEEIVKIIGNTNIKTDFSSCIESMFGECGENDLRTIHFSDCKLEQKVIEALLYGLQEGMFNSNQLIQSITQVRKFTSIGENGISEDGSLRQARVINKGLNFVTYLTIERILEEKERALLAASVCALRHIGSMESKGKGEISARLILNDEDVTIKYMDIFEKEVRRR